MQLHARYIFDMIIGCLCYKDRLWRAVEGHRSEAGEGAAVLVEHVQPHLPLKELALSGATVVGGCNTIAKNTELGARYHEHPVDAEQPRCAIRGACGMDAVAIVLGRDAHHLRIAAASHSFVASSSASQYMGLQRPAPWACSAPTLLPLSAMRNL